MPYDLTLSTPTFADAGVFGKKLTGGFGRATNPVPASGSFTIECRVDTTASGAVRVACGAPAAAWIGITPDGKARATWAAADKDIISTVTINDGNPHHIAFTVEPTSVGSKLYVDGVLAGSNGNVSSIDVSSPFGVHTFGNIGGFDWSGGVDEVVITSGLKYTGNFTPPTAPTSNTAPNLIALWHLNDDGVNSASTAVLPGAPTIGTATAGVGTASVTFTLGTTGTNPTTSFIATASTGETATGSASPIAFGSLSAGVARTIHVQGISIDGTGPASAESNSITPTASGDTTPPVLTGAVTLGTPTSSSVAASWPAGSDNVDVAGCERSIDGGSTYSSVGNVTSTTITGLTPGTAYPPVRVRAFDAAGNRSTPAIVSGAGFTTAAAPAGFTDNILFSPGNWNVQSAFAKTICSGAYFSTLFGGTTCTLNFDLTGVSQPYSKIAYRLDKHGPWNVVSIAATVALSIPSDVAGYQSHFLEVIVDSTSEAVDNWSGGCAVSLTGLTLDSGKTLSKPTARTGGNILFFGDSITRGINTLNASGDATVRSSAQQSWALVAADRLGCESGIVGFGGQGFTVGGSGNIPVFGSTYANLYSGTARSFAGIDAVVVNQGTNDGGNSITTLATAFLNGLIAAIPSTTKVIILRPFNGSHGSEWIAAIAACSTPARVTYVDTAGWFTSANASDGIHPYGYENIFHIAPLAAAAIKTALAATVATALRTVTFTLEEVGGNAVNLTGLGVTFTEAGVQRYASTSQTTNSAGVLSFSFQSTLAGGGIGRLGVLMSDGRHFLGNVAVA